MISSRSKNRDVLNGGGIKQGSRASSPTRRGNGEVDRGRPDVVRAEDVDCNYLGSCFLGRATNVLVCSIRDTESPISCMTVENCSLKGFHSSLDAFPIRNVNLKVFHRHEGMILDASYHCSHLMKAMILERNRRSVCATMLVSSFTSRDDCTESTQHLFKTSSFMQIVRNI